MRILLPALVLLAALAIPGQAQTVSIPVFFEDFDGLTTGNLTNGSSFTAGGNPNATFNNGTGGTRTITALSSLGTLGTVPGWSGNLMTFAGDNQFSGGVPQSPPSFEITLTNLPEHESFDLNFLFLTSNSLDGNPGSTTDKFAIRVSNPDSTGFITLFDSSTDANVTNAFRDVTLDPGVIVGSGTNHFGRGEWDNTYDFSQQSNFSLIPHTADTLTIQFYDGTNSGFSDEGFGIDNLQILLSPPPLTPEPSSILLVSLAFGAMGWVFWRRRQ